MSDDPNASAVSRAAMIENHGTGRGPFHGFGMDDMSPLGKRYRDLTKEEVSRMSEAMVVFSKLGAPDETIGEERGKMFENLLFMCRDDLQVNAVRRLAKIVGTESLSHWLASTIMISNMISNTNQALGPAYLARQVTMKASLDGVLKS